MICLRQAYYPKTGRSPDGTRYHRTNSTAHGRMLSKWQLKRAQACINITFLRAASQLPSRKANRSIPPPVPAACDEPTRAATIAKLLVTWVAVVASVAEGGSAGPVALVVVRAGVVAWLYEG